jgi:two-component system, OmpR family, response regulator
MRVLLIEDDERIARDIAVALGEAGFAVEREQDGASGRTRGESGDFVAVILDLGLPTTDGLDVLKGWREAGLRTPVLILTARGSWMERVQGINTGADDYLPKPFHMEELIARLRALIRRAGGAPAPVRRQGDLVIDTLKKEVSSGGQTIALTPQEYKAINYLVINSGRVVSSAELIAHVHGSNDAVTANAMEALIGRLRRKVGADLIETRRGFGYIVPDG